MSTQIPVWMANEGASVVIRPEGPCTFCICETIDAGLRECAIRSIEHLYFDLSMADWLDSTFTGYLVTFATHRTCKETAIHLVSPSEAARNCLEQMHVLSLFIVEPHLTFSPETWRQLVPVEATREQIGARLVDAHQCLIATDARNEATFAPVVKLFRSGPISPSTSKPS